MSLHIDVPPPLHKFRGQSAMSRDNAALVAEYRQRYKAILDADGLKAAHKALALLDKHLKAILPRAEEQTALQDQLNALKAEHAAAIEEYDAADDETAKAQARTRAEEKKKEARAIAGQLKALTVQLHPHKDQLIERGVLQARIAEHNAAEAQRLQDEQDTLEMRDEANHFAQIMINTWKRLYYSQEVAKVDMTGKRTVVWRTPRFARIIATPDELQFKIDVSRMGLLDTTIQKLPSGVLGYDLVKEETLRELSIACERPVSSPNTDKLIDWSMGLWLRVFRLDSPGGILKLVDYADVMARYPIDDDDKFPLPLGVKAGRQVNWINLIDHPHIMVNGQAGAGKSNAMRVILAALMEHSPDVLKYVLIDLKRGGDFNRFEKTPHCMLPIVKEVSDVAALLGQLVKEMRRRMDLISAANVVDIIRYNQLVAPENRLPRIVIVFDEYTAVHSAGKDLAKDIEWAGIILATQARAAGIQLLIGNQQPYSDAIHKQIKSNVTLVLGGRQRTLGASMSMMGDSSATDLQKIPGRMLCDDGGGTFQVQIPYLSEDKTIEVIKRAVTRWAAPLPFALPSMEQDAAGVTIGQRPPLFDEAMVIRIAIESLDCALKAKRIWEICQDRGIEVSQSQVQKLVKTVIERGTVEHDGSVYQVPGKAEKGNFYRLVLQDSLVA